MRCLSGPDERRTFLAEVAIHLFGASENRQDGLVWMFPNLSIRMKRGHVEFQLPQDELQALAKKSVLA